MTASNPMTWAEEVGASILNPKEGVVNVRPEHFDFIGSDSLIWQKQIVDDFPKGELQFRFVEGGIRLRIKTQGQLQECGCCYGDDIVTEEDLTLEQVESLQDALYAYVAWRQANGN